MKIKKQLQNNNTKNTFRISTPLGAKLGILLLIMAICCLPKEAYATSKEEAAIAMSANTIHNNISLKSLSIDKGRLSPTFNPGITDYTVNLPNNVTSINISAEKNRMRTSLTGIGTKSLSVGVNAFKITVKAKDGTAQDYSIKVTRNSDFDLQKEIDAAHAGTSTDPALITIPAEGYILERVVYLHNSKDTKQKRHIRLSGGQITRGVNFTGTNADNGAMLSLPSGSTLILENIILDGNKNNVSAHGSIIDNYGTVKLGDATLQNNSAKAVGGGVRNYGSFTMIGGAIKNNISNNYGGGVYNYGSFILSGGSITGNKVTGNYGGGGINNRATFIMTGGSITNNSAIFGGGVNNNATFSMTGGKITDNNTSRNEGNDIRHESSTTFKLSGSPVIGTAIEHKGIYLGAYLDNKNGTYTTAYTVELTNPLNVGAYVVFETPAKAVLGRILVENTSTDMPYFHYADSEYALRLTGKNLLLAVAKSNDVDLKKLSIDGSSLSPEFSADITDYRVSVDSEVTSVNISAETNSELAKLSGTGTKVLTVGENKLTISVEAQDGTTKNYNIVVTRARTKSGDTDLKSLSIYKSNLSPEFSADITDYRVSVDSEVTSVNISAETNNELAKLSGTGTKTLSIGENRLTVSVEAQDGSIKNYNIVVTRAHAKSSDTNLKSLSIDGSSLSPEFSADITDYRVSVDSEITSINISAETNNELAKLSGTGTKTLSIGENKLTISVEAQDGTIKDYNIVVTRAQNNDADLKSLSIYESSLSPEFSADITNYRVSVDSDITSINISAETNNELAKLSGTGTKTLSIGENRLTVSVEAQDGTTKNYNILVTRAENNDANLKSLSVIDNTLSPTFSADITDYRLSVDSEVTSVNISAEANSELAKLSGTGTKTLSIGENKLTVSVEAQDGTIKNYNIVVTRAQNNDADLKSLSIYESTLSPTFSADITDYRLSVESEVTSINISAETNNELAKLSGTGTRTLSIGENKLTVSVEAQDGTIKNYNIVVTRAQNNDADLKSLSIYESSLSPEFSADITDYRVSVGSEVTSISISAETNSELAKLSGTGTKTLSIGENRLTVSVEAQDGSIKNYNIVVTRALNNDASLRSLSIYESSLSPEFSADITDYKVSVDSDITSINISAETNNALASITGTGTKALTTGENKFTVNVEAQDGTIKNYNIIVTRAQNNDADLKSLSIYESSLSPEFSADITDYKVSVDSEITSINISAEANSELAKLSGSGTKTLSIGENKLTVSVEAQDGSIKNYNIVVTRALNNDADLKSLSIYESSLSPEFSADITDYTLSVNSDITSINISAEKNNEFANITGTGTKALTVGKNRLTVSVEAQDGTIKDYNIIATRVESNDANLKSLSVIDNTLSPTFSAEIADYRVSVGSEVTSISISAETNNELAKLSGTGTKTLSIGENKLTISVEAQDGTTKDYNIIATRAESSDANLKNLSINKGRLSPEFSADITNYTVNVANSVTSISILAEKNNEFANLSGDIGKTLSVGENLLKVTVTAQDGVTKDYNILVKRSSVFDLQEGIDDAYTSTAEAPTLITIPAEGYVLNKVIYLHNSNNTSQKRHIRLSGGKIIRGANFTGTNADNGAMFYLPSGSSLELENIILDGNKSDVTAHGGIVYNNGTLTLLAGAILQNNSTKAAGGGVRNYGSLIMSGGAIKNNISNSYGGGVYNYGSFALSAGNITGNSASRNEGNDIYYTSSSPLTLSGKPVIGTVTSGKGIYLGAYWDNESNSDIPATSTLSASLTPDASVVFEIPWNAASRRVLVENATASDVAYLHYIGNDYLLHILGSEVQLVEAISDIVTMKTSKTKNENLSVYVEYTGSGTLYANNTTELKSNEWTDIPVSAEQTIILSSLGDVTLTHLDCRNNQLNKLYVRECTALKTLNCDNNQLSSLDISESTELTRLECGNNQLSSLKVSDCTKLEQLYCFYNKLTELEVSECRMLTEFDCSGNKLTELELSICKVLTKLDCSGNQLSNLDVSACTELIEFDCSGNQLSNLEVSACTKLTELYCYNNNLKTIDLTRCSSLAHISAYGQEIEVEVVADATSFANPVYYHNSKEVENIEINNDYYSKDAAINISANTQSLDFKSNAIGQGSPFSGTIFIERGNMDTGSVIAILKTNKIEGENISIYGKWQGEGSIFANGKLLKNDIGIKRTIPVPANQTIVITATDGAKLTEFYCFGNQLSSLDISKCTELEQLYCYYNNLKKLDVSACTKLIGLYCSGNQLKNLDVSACRELITLDCFDNQLSSLNLQGCNALTYLQAYGQKIKVEVADAATSLVNPIFYHNQTRVEKIQIESSTYAQGAAIKISDSILSMDFRSTTIGQNYLDNKYLFGGSITIVRKNIMDNQKLPENSLQELY